MLAEGRMPPVAVEEDRLLPAAAAEENRLLLVPVIAHPRTVIAFSIYILELHGIMTSKSKHNPLECRNSFLLLRKHLRV